jgi:NTP pyrophosphatase (non-canonical NTP hydrolase)
MAFLEIIKNKPMNTNLDLNVLAKQVHNAAREKGFWDKPRNIGELFMLIVSENGEGLEAHRSNKFTHNIDSLSGFAQGDDAEKIRYKTEFEASAKDTFEDEVGDVVIRLMDFVGWRGSMKIQLDYYRKKPKFLLINPNVGETMLLVCGCLYKAYKAHEQACIYGEHSLSELCWATKLEKHINHALAYLYNLADFCGFDLNKHILAKMQYNTTREYLHGKSY